jgi:hypothetical protein
MSAEDDDLPSWNTAPAKTGAFLCGLQGPLQRIDSDLELLGYRRQPQAFPLHLASPRHIHRNLSSPEHFACFHSTL